MGTQKKVQKNLSIDDITDILYSHLKIEFRKYDKVVIIAHSMGGLIAKATILKLIRKKENKITLYLSLNVPNNGSKLADFGKLIFSNANIKDLAPLSKIIDEITRGWIDSKNAKLLPETIYFQGKNDVIVPNESSIGYDSRPTQEVYSDDDHSSILKPHDANSVVMASITHALLETLKKKDSTKKRLINVDISEESIQNITEKIGSKLGISLIAFDENGFKKDDIPQLAVHISKRSNTIKNILKKDDLKWLALIGMYETGKTQLSILIQQYLNLDTIWINFKDYDEKNFTRKLFSSFEVENLEELIAKVESLDCKSKKVFILEDLPKFGNSHLTDNLFTSFIASCLKRDIFIVSTSNYKLPSSIQSIFSDHISEEETPQMSREESLEVLSTYPDSSEFEFKNVIHDITQGYPIYLQVICRFLQKRNWNITHEELINFFSGTLFTELTDQTLSKFVLKVEDQQTRDLLYRLNIIKTPITEREITVISECIPEIDRPFEKLSPILGTWLQRNFDLYIISPLFKRLGVLNLSKSVFREVNYQLGISLIEKKNISQHDFKHVISYFINAEKFDEAGFVTINLLQHCHSNPNYYFDSNLTLYTWYYSLIPREISLFLRLLIRSLQLNISLAIESENNKSSDFLRDDLVRLVNQALVEKVDVYLPSLTLSSYYLREDSTLAIKYFSYYINSYSYKQLPYSDSATFEQLKNLDNSIIWLLLMNINDLPQMINWFDNISKLPLAVEEIVTEQSFLLSNRLFHNFIAKELKLASPDWNGLIEKFIDIYKSSTTNNLQILQALSIKYIIQITSERLDNIADAELFFQQYIASITDDLGTFLVIDELGRQLFYKNENVKSKQYLLQIASYQAEKYVITKVDTLSTLARIISETSREDAHAYMESAFIFIQDNIFIDEITYVTFIGEFATSLLLVDKAHNSMLKFIEGYEFLLDSFENNTSYYNAQVKYGNAIGYLQYLIEKGTARSSDKFTVPYRGMFSKSHGLDDLFFSEKLLIVITIIINYYELINNMSEAHKWAKKIFKLKSKYNINIFHRMLTPLLGYPIMEGHYEVALQYQIEINRLTTKMLESDVSQIENTHEKTITSTIKAAESAVEKDIDFELLVHVLNPILFHLLTRLIKKEIDVVESVSIFKNLLDKFGNFFSNQETLTNLVYLMEYFPTNNLQSQDLMTYTNEIKQPCFGHIQLLSYLICSLQMDPKNALDTHFKLSECFSLYSGSINNKILIPFYFEFWTLKITEYPTAFKNLRKLTLNLAKVSNLPIVFQISAIFALIADDINYTINAKDKLWLQDYYYEYGE
jgi:hypothetical protein